MQYRKPDRNSFSNGHGSASKFKMIKLQTAAVLL